MKQLLEYLADKKRGNLIISRDMGIGYDIALKDIQEFFHPHCSRCGIGITRRSKVCKGCSDLIKEENSRKYNK